jgi:glucose/mannose transport system permease protein
VSQTPAIPTTLTRTKSASRRPISGDRLLSILVISPSVILLAVFVYSFLARTAYVSLVSWNDLLPDYTWAGTRNYVRLFENDRFITDLGNTALFTVPFIVVCLALGLLLASMLDSKIKGEAIFRTIYMFPLAVSFIVTGVAWRWLESPESGLNLIFGTKGFGWFTNPNIGIIAVVLPAVWQISGYVMAMYLAGLRGISDDLREAARVDGASEWRVYWHVIRPLMLPVLMSALVILAHISLKTFDLIYAIAPLDPRTETPAIYMWLTSFRGGFFGRGAAIATMLFFAIALVVVPYIWYTMRRERQR